MTSSVLPESEDRTNPVAAKGVALVGNPNAGKTALFNALTGMRAKTANYPGITVDVRKGAMRLGDESVDLIDLPGLYSLDALTPEEKVAADVLHGRVDSQPRPAVVVLVLDATNLERNLFLASEVLDVRCPTVVALNLMDAANSAQIAIDVARLSDELNCPVVPVSARTGEGLDLLRETLIDALNPKLPLAASDHESCTADCGGCPFVTRFDWAANVAGKTVETPESHGRTTAAIDRVMTDPVVGIVAFLAVMFSVFYLIFSLADLPMALIEDGFAWIGQFVDGLIPTAAVSAPLWIGSVFFTSLAIFALLYRIMGIEWRRTSIAGTIIVSVLVAMLPTADFRSLLIDGVIGGVGGVVVFLPQICILFFFICLLEDSGYLARASFVMERVMRSVGLPGKAFVPMLSAHACAIPGIMATRVIENWRDRLVTIIVLPLMTCSARLPVYAMVAALLFGDSAGKAALVFLGAYLLGIVAALATAFCLKLTILRGETVPLVLELPPYRLPSLRNALLTVWDRALVFVRNAGTVILVISVVLWALVTYPKLPDSEVRAATVERIKSLQAEAKGLDESDSAVLLAEVDRLMGQERLAYSFAGRVGRTIEPVFRPLGFDWKINVGVLSSFAAREVLVSTLAIIYGVGEEAAEDVDGLTDTLDRQTRPDGTPVFTTATCVSLLVFYVLAMQCLPTQVVTRRETGSWGWAVFQFVYMTLLAYVAAWIAFRIAMCFS